MNKKLYADRLSDLVLTIGINLQKGEFLNIVVSPDAYFYAQNMAIKKEPSIKKMTIYLLVRTI